MYSILQYGQMIADPVRMDAYARALRRAVRPGSVVLDVGAGTGIFSLLACQLGARRVYAVEPDGAIEAAREIAAANGFEERIRFLGERIEDVKLPEKVDVLVSDLRGSLPFHGTHLRAIAEARQRFLAPGGTLVPLRDELKAVPVQVGQLYDQNAAIWTDNAWGLDMSPARRLVTNTLWSASRSQKVLAKARHLATIDYASLGSVSLRSDSTWRITRAGTAHGLLLWFDATLAEGIGFSNAPHRRARVYGRVCLPLAEPVDVGEGDAFEARVSADLVDADYVWSWEGVVRERGPGGAVKARFRQSSFYGAPLSADRLRSRALDHAPGLNAWGRIDALALELMGRGVALEGIARRLACSFPERFPRWRDAVDRVGSLSAQYGGD